MPSRDTQSPTIPTKRYPPESFVVASWHSIFLPGNLRSSVDQAEDVVEHEEAASTVGFQREELGVVHGLLLFVNLIAPTLLEHRPYCTSVGNQ